MLNYDLIIKDQSGILKTASLGHNLSVEKVKENRVTAIESFKLDVIAKNIEIDEPLETTIITWGTPEKVE